MREQTEATTRRTLNTNVLRGAGLESVETVSLHDQIARRAYELFLARGGVAGRAQEDWLEAERQLDLQGVYGLVRR